MAATAPARNQSTVKTSFGLVAMLFMAQLGNAWAGESSITFMRDENGKWEQPTNHVLDNKIERRTYSLLLAARTTLGPQATQPQCAENLSPTQRRLISQLAAVNDTVVTPRLSHEILLYQDTLQQMSYCIQAANRSARR